jgi:Domain of unknown function (DUF6438)
LGDAVQARSSAIVAGCVLALGAIALAAVAAQQSNPGDGPLVKLDESEANLGEHTLGPMTAVHVSALEAAKLEFESYVSFEIVVSPDGHVESAMPVGEERLHLDEARAIEMARRFTPWMRDGKSIRVAVRDYVELLPPERWALVPRSFPEPWDLKSVEIKLSRTVCYGRCPEYTVVIRGDGTVQFDGGSYVLMPGKHEAHVAPGAVKELVEEFEKAKFFAAADKYIATVTDNPTYTLTLKAGGKAKTVTDYVGTQVGMPLAIVNLERDVDDVAGTERWIRGKVEGTGL